MTTLKASPVYRISDGAVPAHVRAAAKRSPKDIKHVVHLPGCWQLLTDEALEAYKRNSKRLLGLEGGNE